MLAVPDDKLAVGVKVAVRVSPDPLMAPRVPPVTTTSPVVPSQLKPVGASLKVNVIVAVCAARTTAELLVIASVGATESMAITGVTAAAPKLPAASL